MAPILAINAKVKDVAGFPVRRALPAIERRMIGPFVFLDQMGPTRLAPGQRLDVRPHPHIGLSTMTYLLEGEILHRDSLGTVQMIRPGAINWMMAGSGIAHSERTPEETGRGGVLSGIQFWVALPRSHEEMAPAFLHLEAAVLPVLEDRNVSARIIAGAAFGGRSPLSAPHPMICMDIAMAKGASLGRRQIIRNRRSMSQAGRSSWLAAAIGRGSCWFCPRACWQAFKPSRMPG